MDETETFGVIPHLTWNCIPGEILVEILLKMLNGSSSEVLNELYVLMQVDKRFYEITSDNIIWKHVATKFSDFARLLKRYKATDKTWYELCFERVSKVFMEQVILVGDRNNPEDKILIQIHGNGQMFIGRQETNASRLEWLKFMSLYESDPNNRNHIIVENSNTTYLLLPYTAHYIDLRSPVGTPTNHSNIVDLSNYDPFVLVLTLEGDVLQFLFKPSWDTRYDQLAYPRRIKIDAVVEKIYAMDYCCMALADGYCYAWTIIENPLVGQDDQLPIIETIPVRLESLADKFVYYVSRIGESTRLYYKPRNQITEDTRLVLRSPWLEDTATYDDVRNEFVMDVMIKSAFTVDELIRIENLLHDIQ